jgi:hypothetical protein
VVEVVVKEELVGEEIVIIIEIETEAEIQDRDKKLI